MSRPGDNHGTAERGRMVAAAALASRGARVGEHREGRVRYLTLLRDGAASPIHLRVKTRTGGTWQGSITDAPKDPAPAAVPTFWMFVDLAQARPGFYIVPDAWMRRDIHAAHQQYLRRHGGQRAHSPESTHHAIQLERIAEWRDRWDLLGL